MNRTLPVCQYCHGPIPAARLRRHAIFCHTRCSHAAERQRNRRQYKGFPQLSLAQSWQGGASELRIAVDLIERGYEVFRQLVPYASCDLIILYQGRCYRVECRTGTFRKDGTIRASATSSIRADILAIATHTGVIYTPALPVD